MSGGREEGCRFEGLWLFVGVFACWGGDLHLSMGCTSMEMVWWYVHLHQQVSFDVNPELILFFVFLVKLVLQLFNMARK